MFTHVGNFRVLSDREIAAVLKEARHYGPPKDRGMWAAVFGLLCEFGPRVSELSQDFFLRSDVDLTKCYRLADGTEIHGEVALTTLKRWRTVEDGEGNKLRVRVPLKRVLPLRPWLADLLRTHLDGSRGASVFSGTTHHSWRRRVWRAWKAACTKAGVKNRRLHDARHTVATRLAEVDPILARDVLGHASLSTTNTYIHCRNLASRFLSAPGAMGTAA